MCVRPGCQGKRGRSTCKFVAGLPALCFSPPSARGQWPEAFISLVERHVSTGQLFHTRLSIGFRFCVFQKSTLESFDWQEASPFAAVLSLWVSLGTTTAG